MQSSKPRLASLLVIFCAVLLLGVPLHAQVTTGTIRGTVVDEQNAAVSEADVTVTNVDTAYSRSMKTSGTGEFVFTDLPLGMYRLQASHSGFKETTQTGIELHVAQTIVIDVGLKVGAISEKVTVEASPLQVETTTGEVSGLIQGSQVRELPLNGRSFAQLLTLMPGVATADGFDPKNKGLLSAIDMSVSGGSSNANLFLVDGGHNNDVGSNRTILVFPSIDTIEEFRIHRNSYGPEFGQAAGAQVNIITKSGSNDYHGSAYYFGRNDVLNPHNYFLNLNPACFSSAASNDPNCSKQKLRRNDFGYTFGGPIRKDKIFFFWSQEWNREIRGRVNTARVPTAAERQGNFSQSCPSHPVPIDPDPSSPGYGNPFPGAQIPQSRVNPVGQLLFSTLPLPTLSDPCAPLNWIQSVNTQQYWREESVRGDINLTKTLNLVLRFTNDSWDLPAPSGAPGFWGDPPFPTLAQGWKQPSRMAVARLSKTIGTSGVNDFQFTYSANRIDISIGGENPGLQKQLNQAIPTVFDPTQKLHGEDRAHVTIWGSNLVPTVWDIAPWTNQQDLLTWQDDFSMVKGKHAFKAGFLFGHNLKNEQTANATSGEIWGVVGFNGVPTWADPNAVTGNQVADYLLRGMSFGYDESQTDSFVRNRWRDIEFYAGDNWRVSRRLTLEYGIRWSFIRAPYLADDRYSTFNPIAFDQTLGGQDPCNGILFSPDVANPCAAAGFLGGRPGPNRGLMNNNSHAIAPRIGVAWDPTGSGKWAIRAGIGQFFNRDRLFSLQIAGTNPPFISNIGTTSGRLLESIAPLPGCGGTMALCYSAGAGRPTRGNDLGDDQPNSWQWNLTVEHEVLRNAKFEVSYVANRNLHWENRLDINAVPNTPGTRLNYVRLAGQTDARAALRPFGANSAGTTAIGNNGIIFYTHGSDSIYHSLQSMFNMRFSRGSLFQAAYTFSKLISNSDRFDTPDLMVDAYDLRYDRGPDPLNRPHVFSANFVYHTPTLANANSALRHTFGEWELSSILTMATGPSQKFIIGTLANLSDPAGIGSSNAVDVERPNRVPGQGCRADDGQSHHWFNPNAFTVNGYQLGTLGNASRGICSAPGNNNVDFSLMKNFKVTERIKAQFRMEFYNLFNHPQFLASSVKTSLDPSGTQFFDASGNPTTLANAVTIGGTTNAANFGHASQLRGTGIREIQYALKFIF